MTDDKLKPLENLLRYHETGGHEGDGSDDAMRKAREALEARATDTQVSSLVSALEQIADPIGFMQQRAKDEGRQIDGQMAVLISKDAEFLKSIARATLDGIVTGRV